MRESFAVIYTHNSVKALSLAGDNMCIWLLCNVYIWFPTFLFFILLRYDVIMYVYMFSKDETEWNWIEVVCFQWNENKRKSNPLRQLVGNSFSSIFIFSLYFSIKKNAELCGKMWFDF